MKTGDTDVIHQVASDAWAKLSVSEIAGTSMKIE
jgi:hypothetical protein